MGLSIHMPSRSPTPKAASASPRLNATIDTLPNGLEVLVQEDHAHPLASVQLWVRAGSIHEEAWTGAGLAHLTEHMLFKGTKTRTAQQLSQSIQALGGQVNAYTSFNRTVYWIDGLSENVDGYVDILADMAQRSAFDPEELEREKDVIRREMAMDVDDPGSAAQHLMQATAFRVHPMRHPVIGHRSVFDQVNHAALVAFVRRHYSPNNCFLVVAGAVTREDVLAIARKHFGDWQRQPFEPVMLPIEPPQHASRQNRAAMQAEHTRIQIGWPIIGDSHPDKAALDVLAFLLGSGRSSRLTRELREKQGLAHSVWAGAWSAAECGHFSIDADCLPADAPATIEGMKRVIDTIRARGPSIAELDKAVRATMASQIRTLTTTRGQASSIGNGWLVTHSLDYAQLYLDRIKALRPATIRNVARHYLTPHTSNLIVIEPLAAQATTTKTTMVATQREAAQKLVLANGLTVLLRRNPRLPLVSIRTGFLAGVLAETDRNAGISQITANLLMKGTRKHSADELATVLEARGGMLHTVADAHRIMASAEVVRGDELLALDVIADLLRNASLPASQLTLVKKRQVASIREEQEDPLTVALRRARSEIFAGTPFHRTALGNEQTVNALTVNECRKLLTSQITGANGIVTVVGDFDPKAVKQRIESTLGRLPRGKRDFANLDTLATEGKPATIDITMNKEQAVLVIGFRTVGLHHADAQVLNMIDEACSDMGSRLFNRIREELGLAYYVGAQSFNAWGAGAFYFYVGTEQAKLDLAQKEMLKQIADLAKNGLQDDELKRAKTTWKSNWLRAQQGNGAMADALSWDELNGHGHERFERLPAQIDAITPKDVKRVAAQFFQRAQAYIVRVVR